MTSQELNSYDTRYQLKTISISIDDLLDLLRVSPFDQIQLDRVRARYHHIQIHTRQFVENHTAEQHAALPLQVQLAIQELMNLNDADFQHRLFCEGTLQSIQRPIDLYINRKD